MTPHILNLKLDYFWSASRTGQQGQEYEAPTGYVAGCDPITANRILSAFDGIRPRQTIS
jgi:hypothetical protein